MITWNISQLDRQTSDGFVTDLCEKRRLRERQGRKHKRINAIYDRVNEEENE